MFETVNKNTIKQIKRSDFEHSVQNLNFENKMSSNYQNIRKIGQGEHGSVYLVQKKNSFKSNQRQSVNHQVEQELYAMKKIPITKNYFDFQAKLLLTLNHPNVIQVNQVFHEKENLVLILQLAEEGDLHQYIKRNHFKKVPQTQVVSWFCQLCLGLYYLHHENNIIHRDIKLRNILVKQNGLLKLADFGVAKKLQKGEDFAKTSVGTPCYLSPEAINYGIYDNKSDVWSLGCLLYEICTGEKPFSGESLGTLLHNIVNSSCAEIPNRYSSWLKHIIIDMLEKNPQKRPGIQDLLQIPEIRKEFKALKEKYAQYEKLTYPQEGPKTTKYLAIDDKKLNNLRIFSQSLKTTKNQRSIRHQIQGNNSGNEQSGNKQKVKEYKQRNLINDCTLLNTKITLEPNRIKYVERKPLNSVFQLKTSQFLAPQKVEKRIELTKGINISCSLNKVTSSNGNLLPNPSRKVERDKFIDKSLKSLIAKRTTDKVSKSKDLNKN